MHTHKKQILGNVDTLVAYMYTCMHVHTHAYMHAGVHAREYKFTSQIQIYLPQNKKKQKKSNLGDGEDDAKEGSQVEGREDVFRNLPESV